MAKITVLGAGGWGMALALVANSKNHTVNIWSPFEEEVANLLEKRTNERLLKGVYLNEEIGVTTDINIASGSDITIIAVPSVAVKSACEALAKVDGTGITVNVAKGFENGSGRLLSDVITESLPERELVVLSGPSHAEEVALSLPTTVTAASNNYESALKVQALLSTENFRIYTNSDVTGVELGGALKNVIAVCSGICAGLGLGDNTRAAMMTRGLSEMTRLGTVMGASERTFLGLSGIGDLIVTCLSDHSRNNRFGKLVGGGMDVKEALDTVGTVEGYYAAQHAHNLAKKFSIELPIIEKCYEILYKDKSAKDAINMLLSRPLRTE